VGLFLLEDSAMRAIAPLMDRQKIEPGFRAAVIVNRRHARHGTVDGLGLMVLETLQNMGVRDLRYREQPTKADALRRMVLGYCQEGLNLVLVLGGSATAQGPQVVRSLAEHELPWVPSTLAREGKPFKRSSLGFSVVASRKSTLLAAVPGDLVSLGHALKAMAPHLLDAYLDVLSPSLAQAA
jgi:cyclic pyranopterin phosphate synthase